MIRVGLTGGIGSGKSAVAALFAAHGAVIVDADQIAREVVEPGTEGLAAVVAAFGAEVLQPDGTLDRGALATLVFADPASLATLNAILHPLIATRTRERTAAARGARVLVHDVALLVENGLQGEYDAVVVVAVEPATQLARLVGQRGMSEPDARARIAAQAQPAQRLAAATYVIDNDGPRDALAPQVARVWAELLAESVRPRT